MCFTSKKTVARIAKTDIQCWKLLQNINGVIVSPYKNSFIWNTEVQYGDVVRIKDSGEGITKGFHAFMNKEVATRRRIDYGKGHHVVPAIIPAGSIYWVNATEIVADRIQIKKLPK